LFDHLDDILHVPFFDPVENLILDNNFLSEQIPDVFANYQQLDFFDVSNAGLSGTIPESLFAVSTLRIAYLSNNTIGGTIPAVIADPPLLKDLYLDGNGLTGTVPDVQPNQLTNLNEFLLQFNFLTGSMPESICALRGNAGDLDDLFSDCGGLNPEILCDYPECCNRCFEGGREGRRLAKGHARQFTHPGPSEWKERRTLANLSL
jgi:hypothetical protein